MVDETLLKQVQRYLMEAEIGAFKRNNMVLVLNKRDSVL